MCTGPIIILSSATSSNRKRSGLVSFNKQELNAILRYYGQMVAAGKWRDYAINHLNDRAVFSIFRHSAEMPLFRIEKHPGYASYQGIYSVIAKNGHILKRGHNLRQTLCVFDRHLMKII